MNLCYIKDLPCPNEFWITPQKIEDAMDFLPRNGDIIITSYPKTGTHWLTYIVHQILTKEDKLPSLKEAGHKIAPILEVAGTAAVDQMEGQRMYRHHFPFDKMKTNGQAKFLYIYRRPEDTLVSYFQFLNGLLHETVDMDTFFECFISGKIAYGNYFEHVLSFLKHQNEENLLLVCFEDLKANTKQEILRIAKFLGNEYFEPLLADNTLLERILEHTSFDFMKKNISNTTSFEDWNKQHSSPPPKEISIFRKGNVGDGKLSLSPTQLQRLRKSGKDILKEYPSVLKAWFSD